MPQSILDTHIKRWFPRLLLGGIVKFNDPFYLFDDRIDHWVRAIEHHADMIEYVTVPSRNMTDFWVDYPSFKFAFFLLYPNRNKMIGASPTNQDDRYTGIVWTRTTNGISYVRNVTDERI